MENAEELQQVGEAARRTLNLVLCRLMIRRHQRRIDKLDAVITPVKRELPADQTTSVM